MTLTIEKPVPRTEYTTEQIAALRTVFLEVSASDWKKSVSRVMWRQSPKRMRLIEAAVMYYTGSVVWWCNASGGRVRINFDGYYAMEQLGTQGGSV
jgi:hypothetical protein